MLLKRFLPILLLSSLAACAARSPGVVTTPSVNRPQPSIQVPPETTSSKPAAQDENTISASLRTQATVEIDQANYPQATRLLERALRADPRDAANYYQFARLRLKQQQPGRARQLIDKGLSLQPGEKLRMELLELKNKTN